MLRLAGSGACRGRKHNGGNPQLQLGSAALCLGVNPRQRKEASCLPLRPLSLLVDFSFSLTRVHDKSSLNGGKICLGSWFQRFEARVSGGFGSVASQQEGSGPEQPANQELKKTSYD